MEQQPLGAIAITVIATVLTFAAWLVPSTGQYNVNFRAKFNFFTNVEHRLSISPSPITTVPLMLTVSNIWRIASTAKPSAPFIAFTN